MSLPIRTRIGSNLRTLSRRLDALSSFLQERSTTVDTLDDHELLIDIEYLNDARLDVVHLFRKIETALDKWSSLGITDPKEKESHTSFTTTNEPYLHLTSETRKTLSLADDILTTLVQEATIRGLEVPPTPDGLSSHGSIHLLPSTRRSSNTSAATEAHHTAPVPIKASDASSAHEVPTTTHMETHSLHSSRSSVSSHSDSSRPALPAAAPIHTPHPPTPQLAPSLFLQSALVSRAQLPSFDGDIIKWPPFKAAFIALLGDATLPGCHKLAILKSCLIGEASQMISGLSQIDQDYETAMAILHAEYDRPALIRHALMARLQSIENCDPEGTQLRRIYMELTTLIHQLCPEGEIDSPDFLVNLIITKLPISLQTRIMKQAQRKTIGVFSVLNIMRDAVDDDRIEQLLTVAHSPRMTHSPTPIHPSPPSHPPASQSTYSSEHPLSCLLCDGPHFTKHCRSFKSPHNKKNAVIEKGLCLNCLSRSHQVDSCINKHSCWYCQQRHHSSICTDRPPPRDITQEHSSHPPRHPSHHRYQEERNFRPHPQPSRDVTLHINSSPLAHEKNSQLLCLDIDISSPDRPQDQTTVTLVFDSGSNQSFVSTDLVTHLNLPTSQQNTRTRTVFGNEEPQSHLTSTHPLLITLPSGQQEKIHLHAGKSVCPTLDWTEKKGELLIPRRSRPTILLGMDLLRKYFFTSSLRVDSFIDHDVIHTILGDCISTEKEDESDSIATLTFPETKLLPDNARSLGDESVRHTEENSHSPSPNSIIPSEPAASPTADSTSLHHTLVSQPLSSFQAARDLLPCSRPSSLSHLVDSLALSDGATLSHPPASRKDNPSAIADAFAPSPSSGHSLRPGG